MTNFGEQAKFEITPTIEQKPFENEAVQSFFVKWCEINDSIVPQFIDRAVWEQKGAERMLEKTPDGKQNLYIPHDLQLWEMLDVMATVDHDTYNDKTEKQDEAKNKVLALGQTFQNAGIYIAQRLDSINEGREIADSLSTDFYDYGQSLKDGKKNEIHSNTKDIALANLSDSETLELDQFLAGNNLYQSRKIRVDSSAQSDPDKRRDLDETQRRQTLSQFFKVSAQAFALNEKEEKGALAKPRHSLKPWKKVASVHSSFINKIEHKVKQKIETPKIEFQNALFRRGLVKLTSEMKKPGWKKSANNFFKKNGIDLHLKQKKLIDSLGIARLKSELETIRQSGDNKKIALKEREIADKIQKEVNHFPYRQDANNPAEMAANQYINCVGASMLGGALMKEAGLEYLTACIPEHSILFLITSDGQVEWRDMLDNSLNVNLDNDRIKGNKKDKTPLTVADIADFGKHPEPEGLMFEVENIKYQNRLSEIGNYQKLFAVVFAPERGEQLQILNNNGAALGALKLYEEATEAYRQAIALDHSFFYPYLGLAAALKNRGLYKEAIETYRQAFTIDPNSEVAYLGLADAFKKIGHAKEAIQIYKELISNAKKSADASSVIIFEEKIKELEP